VRNIEKAEQEKFISRLGRFLDLHQGKRYFITPYASEFFSPFEAKSSASIRNGLDGVRLELRKHYFENESLLNFLARLKRYFPEQLSIPSGVRDYSDERAQSRQESADENCTIWFVTDGGLNFNAKDRVANKSKSLYIIAYAQTHLNNNQLIIFKERKPGWIASTTLPHSLSAAMVNVARHNWELTQREREGRDGKTVILDPFCGTGTTLLDVLTRFSNSIIIGLDQAPIMPTLVHSNLEFLSAKTNEISSILSMLRSVASYVENEIENGSADGMIARMSRRELSGSDALPARRIPEHDFEFCLSLLIDEITAAKGGAGGEISDASVVKLASLGFSDSVIARLKSDRFPFSLKILFYMLWRALLMNTFSMRPEARTPRVVFSIFLEELEKSIKEYQDLEKLLKRRVAVDNQPFGERIGSYSREGIIHPEFFASGPAKAIELDATRVDVRAVGALSPGLFLCRVDDSIALLEKLGQVADLIISDPPYGFNALEAETEDMKSLYARMIPAFINALRPWGQLMIAVPAFAKNGKQIPFYQTRESVIKQIIAHVEASGRKIVKHVETLPADREVFQLPWYWGTASTIERRIIHFVVD
jgi:16S rRNA G966 N2-methylase RsmD